MNDVETMVVGIIGSSDVQKVNSFTFYGKTFSIGTFANIKDLIEKGFIKGVYDASKAGMAEYDYATNTLYLGFSSTSELSKKALVVHECVHAVYDQVKMKMSVQDSESIAYIVQCQYARANNPSSSNRLMSNDPKKDKVFEVGWRIAGKLLGQDSSGLTDSDYADMREAVAAHPYYAKNAKSDAGFNG